MTCRWTRRCQEMADEATVGVVVGDIIETLRVVDQRSMARVSGIGIAANNTEWGKHKWGSSRREQRQHPKQ